MSRRLAPVVLVSVLLFSACARDLSWQDDFTDPSAWQAESDATAEVEVRDGVMRVFIAVPNKLAWAVAGRDLRDFHLSVEATQAGGPDDNEYGVLVRMEDASNFYRFSISGDGYFNISKFVAGVREPIESDWMVSDAILQGQATNVVEVICQGSVLALVVNDQELARVEDDEFSRGDVGLYAGSFYEGGVEIHFDNLSVTEP